MELLQSYWWALGIVIVAIGVALNTKRRGSK